MPELPEIETILRGLTPQIKGSIIQKVIIRQTQLRWPISTTLNDFLNQQTIIHLSRRGKYLLIHLAKGVLIIHLGMSGSLRIVHKNHAPSLHDHVDIELSENKLLRYNDPRRFGAILISTENPEHHPLLQSLGIEPLDPHFNGAYLKQISCKRRVAIKQLIMNSKIVTGIGNIYAQEALFLAQIHPLTPAQSLTLPQCHLLVKAIKETLDAAILQGGTTLKDFVNSEGKPGYFSQKLQVYGRKGLPCLLCGVNLDNIQIGKRSTVYCPQCQPFPK